MTAPSRAGDEAARWKQGATRIGVSYRRYRAHVLAGDRWCSGHRRWHPAEAFRPSKGYDRNTSCQTWRRAYMRAYDARRRSP